MRAQGNLYETFLAGVEPDFLRRIMVDCGWNKCKAARVLWINRATLRKKLRLYEIEAAEQNPCSRCGNSFIECFGEDGRQGWWVGCKKPCNNHVHGKTRRQAIAKWNAAHPLAGC